MQYLTVKKLTKTSLKNSTVKIQQVQVLMLCQNYAKAKYAYHHFELLFTQHFQVLQCGFISNINHKLCFSTNKEY